MQHFDKAEYITAEGFQRMQFDHQRDTRSPGRCASIFGVKVLIYGPYPVRAVQKAAETNHYYLLHLT